MRVLSLFSGGGLGDYGLELAGMEIVGQVEIDNYCQKILKLRWPDVPKWRDIKEFKGTEVKGVDLVAGGFPCQPFSVAGKRKGSDDHRDLWKEMFRVICEARPRWVLAENVPGLLSISNGRKFGEVVRDLASVGYCVEWDCIPASAVGAPHQRDRVWIVAHTRGGRLSKQGNVDEQQGGTETVGSSKDIPKGETEDGENVDHTKHNGQPAAEVEGSVVERSICLKKREIEASEPERSSVKRTSLADPKFKRRNKRTGKALRPQKQEAVRQDFGDVCEEGEDVAYTEISKRDGNENVPQNESIEAQTVFGNGSGSGQLNTRWATEPNVGRVAHGVANRVDRLKLLGNGQVVQVVEWIGKRIMEFDRGLKGD